jgi:hypothetical protein
VGLQIKDSQIVQAANIGIELESCSDVRLADNIVQSILGTSGSSLAGVGVHFSGVDLSITGGVIEQNFGADIDLDTASYVNITGTFIGSSGRGSTGTSNPGTAPGLFIKNSQHFSLCGNRFQGNGGVYSSTAHVLLQGTLDNITFCGNEYEARNSGDHNNDPNAYPWYVYDVSGTPTITNMHFYETPAQQAVSVFSAAAQPYLPSLRVPQFTQNQLSGLTLSNGSSGQLINVAAESAADSTNSTLITLPSSCQINLGNNGANGLDTGSVAASTTYYIFVIASATANPTSGSPTPSCMASTSLVPNFQGVPSMGPLYFAGSGYLVNTTGGTNPGGVYPTNYTIFCPTSYVRYQLKSPSGCRGR